ncbi:hypothetical protein CR513_55108, partial [Mucuna pruriens]
MDARLVQVGRMSKDTQIAVIKAEKQIGNGSRPIIIHYTPMGSTSKPLEIRVSVPFHYKNSKAVPRKYTTEIEPASPDIITISKSHILGSLRFLESLALRYVI